MSGLFFQILISELFIISNIGIVLFSIYSIILVSMHYLQSKKSFSTNKCSKTKMFMFLKHIQINTETREPNNFAVVILQEKVSGFEFVCSSYVFLLGALVSSRSANYIQIRSGFSK